GGALHVIARIDARTLPADLTAGARHVRAAAADVVGAHAALVDHPVAVVVGAVADLVARVVDLHAFDRVAAALGDAVLAEAGQAGVARGSAARALDAADRGHDVGEV